MATGEGVSVTVSGLRREFGAVTALDGIDLTIETPQILGVAGPNGSGKTTLIRCLLGLLAPTAGTVEVWGQDATALDIGRRQHIGYMPQAEAVYRDLTVHENVSFFARLYDVENRRNAVADALELVDLGNRADDRVATLSGGMVRRTSLACAIVHNPRMLVLDEPTVGLDPELRASMWDGFRIRRENGCFVLVSTHYLGEVRNCDRVLFLRDGQELAIGAPTTFLEETGADDLEAAFLALLEQAGGES